MAPPRIARSWTRQRLPNTGTFWPRSLLLLLLHYSGPCLVRFYARRLTLTLSILQIDNYDGPELGDLITKFDIRNPDGNGEVLPPMPFNLMFKSTVGPSAAAPVYLRPETAQGQFLNFRKLLDFNQDAMPFASASIGKSYRNEISPRSGLLRVREFLMAEVEHYVDPEKKEHERFAEVAQLGLPLLDKKTQLAGQTTPRNVSIEDAVKSGTVDNETLGYFLGRIMLFLLKIGVDPSKIRFRQHLDNEMAHYACDCWDAELLTSYGWIESVGCADRSAYDLTAHSKFTGTPLVVKEALRTGPVKVECWQASLDKKLVGPRFKRDAKAVQASVEALDQLLLERLAAELNATGSVIVETATPLADGSSSVELSHDSKGDPASDCSGIYPQCHRAFFWHRPYIVLFT